MYGNVKGLSSDRPMLEIGEFKKYHGLASQSVFP